MSTNSTKVSVKGKEARVIEQSKEFDKTNQELTQALTDLIELREDVKKETKKKEKYKAKYIKYKKMIEEKQAELDKCKEDY